MRSSRSTRRSTSPADHQAAPGCPASSRSRAASTRRCIAAGSGPCASSPASAPREDTNERYKFLLEHGQTGLSVAFDFPTLMGYDSDHPALGGRGRQVRRRDLEPRRHGDALRRHSARPGLDVDDDQRPGGDPVLLLRRRRRAPGRADRPAPRHDSERHPEGVHGAARLDLSRRSPRSRSSSTCSSGRRSTRRKWNTISISGYHIREAGATAAQELAFTLANGFTYVEHGTRPRARRRSRSRRGCRSSGTSTTTSSRRSPSCARRAASGRATCASATARRTRGRWRMRFHSQTAGVTLTAQQPHEQRRARRLPGAGRGAGRHAVAAHQLDGRDARAADRGIGADRAPHPADPRLRDRRAQRRRPARRLVLRRGAHRRSSSARPRSCSPRSRRRAAWCRRSRAAGSSARSPARRCASSARWSRAGARSWA